MKKRTLTIIAVLAAVSMLSFAVFAGNDVYEGYERFKDLLRNDQLEESHAGTGTVTILDNGQEVLKVAGSFVGDEEQMNGYGQVTIESDSVSKSLEVYGQNETMYIVDGNDVYTKSHDQEEYGRHGRYQNDFEKDEFDSRSEAVMDFFMGDFKDDFTLDGENIVFELTKDEMPAFLNMMSSGDMDHDMRDEMPLEGYPLLDELKGLETALPELSDTELQYIKVTIKVTDQVVQGLDMNVIVTGLDAAGNTHEIEVIIEANDGSDLEMKTFELNDQTVYEIKEER